tara:strand:- start:97 stop:483 length:387 start_codon:yes stop_codon:yes gene_type:complete
MSEYNTDHSDNNGVEPEEVVGPVPTDDAIQEPSTTEVDNAVSALQSEVDSNEESVELEEKQVTALLDGASYDTFTTTARTIREFLIERNMNPNDSVVQTGDGSYISDLDAPIGSDEVYHAIARNKTGG